MTNCLHDYNLDEVQDLYQMIDQNDEEEMKPIITQESQPRIEVIGAWKTVTEDTKLKETQRKSFQPQSPMPNMVHQIKIENRPKGSKEDLQDSIESPK